MKFSDRLSNCTEDQFLQALNDHLWDVVGPNLTCSRDKVKELVQGFARHYSQSGFFEGEQFLLDNNRPVQTIDTPDRGSIPCSVFSLWASYIHKEIDLYKPCTLVQPTEQGFEMCVLDTHLNLSEFLKSQRRVCPKLAVYEQMSQTYPLLQLQPDDYTTSVDWLCHFIGNMSKQDPDTLKDDLSIRLTSAGVTDLRKIVDKDNNLLCFVHSSQSEEYLHWEFTVYKDGALVRQLGLGNYVIVSLWEEAKQLGLKLDLGISRGFEWKQLWKPATVWAPGLEWRRDTL